VFDKTGTLTEGKPAVTDAIICGNPRVLEDAFHDSESSRDRLLRLAATAEQGSEHPLASAVLKAAKARGLHLQKLSDNSFQSITGKGVRCLCNLSTINQNGNDEGEVLVGNRSFLEDHHIVIDVNTDNAMTEIELQGKTAVCVAVEGQILGVLGIADVPKDEAAQTVAALKAIGVDVWMVTGDNRTTAEAIAGLLNIPKHRVVASALPKDKVSKVEELQKLGQSVAVVGDGVNDSVS
jgi:Cu+-exporting ATPase